MHFLRQTSAFLFHKSAPNFSFQGDSKKIYSAHDRRNLDDTVETNSSPTSRTKIDAYLNATPDSLQMKKSTAHSTRFPSRYSMKSNYDTFIELSFESPLVNEYVHDECYVEEDTKKLLEQPSYLLQDPSLSDSPSTIISPESKDLPLLEELATICEETHKDFSIRFFFGKPHSQQKFSGNTMIENTLSTSKSLYPRRLLLDQALMRKKSAFLSGLFLSIRNEKELFQQKIRDQRRPTDNASTLHPSPYDSYYIHNECSNGRTLCRGENNTTESETATPAQDLENSTDQMPERDRYSQWNVPAEENVLHHEMKLFTKSLFPPECLKFSKPFPKSFESSRLEESNIVPSCSIENILSSNKKSYSLRTLATRKETNTSANVRQEGNQLSPFLSMIPRIFDTFCISSTEGSAKDLVRFYPDLSVLVLDLLRRQPEEARHQTLLTTSKLEWLAQGILEYVYDGERTAKREIAFSSRTLSVLFPKTDSKEVKKYSYTVLRNAYGEDEVLLGQRPLVAQSRSTPTFVIKNKIQATEWIVAIQAFVSLENLACHFSQDSVSVLYKPKLVSFIIASLGACMDLPPPKNSNLGTNAHSKESSTRNSDSILSLYERSQKYNCAVSDFALSYVMRALHKKPEKSWEMYTNSRRLQTAAHGSLQVWALYLLKSHCLSWWRAVNLLGDILAYRRHALYERRTIGDFCKRSSADATGQLEEFEHPTKEKFRPTETELISVLSSAASWEQCAITLRYAYDVSVGAGHSFSSWRLCILCLRRLGQLKSKRVVSLQLKSVCSNIVWKMARMRKSVPTLARLHAATILLENTLWNLALAVLQSDSTISHVHHLSKSLVKQKYIEVPSWMEALSLIRCNKMRKVPLAIFEALLRSLIFDFPSHVCTNRWLGEKLTTPWKVVVYVVESWRQNGTVWPYSSAPFHLSPYASALLYTVPKIPSKGILDTIAAPVCLFMDNTFDTILLKRLDYAALFRLIRCSAVAKGVDECVVGGKRPEFPFSLSKFLSIGPLWTAAIHVWLNFEGARVHGHLIELLLRHRLYHKTTNLENTLYVPSEEKTTDQRYPNFNKIMLRAERKRLPLNKAANVRPMQENDLRAWLLSAAPISRTTAHYYIRTYAKYLCDDTLGADNRDPTSHHDVTIPEFQERSRIEMHALLRHCPTGRLLIEKYFPSLQIKCNWDVGDFLQAFMLQQASKNVPFHSEIGEDRGTNFLNSNFGGHTEVAWNLSLSSGGRKFIDVLVHHVEMPNFIEIIGTDVDSGIRRLNQSDNVKISRWIVPPWEVILSHYAAALKKHQLKPKLPKERKLFARARESPGGLCRESEDSIEVSSISSASTYKIFAALAVSRPWALRHATTDYFLTPLSWFVHRVHVAERKRNIYRYGNYLLYSAMRMPAGESLILAIHIMQQEVFGLLEENAKAVNTLRDCFCNPLLLKNLHAENDKLSFGDIGSILQLNSILGNKLQGATKVKDVTVMDWERALHSFRAICTRSGVQWTPKHDSDTHCHSKESFARFDSQLIRDARKINEVELPYSIAVQLSRNCDGHELSRLLLHPAYFRPSLKSSCTHLSVFLQVINPALDDEIRFRLPVRLPVDVILRLTDLLWDEKEAFITEHENKLNLKSTKTLFSGKRIPALLNLDQESLRLQSVSEYYLRVSCNYVEWVNIVFRNMKFYPALTSRLLLYITNTTKHKIKASKGTTNLFSVVKRGEGMDLPISISTEIRRIYRHLLDTPMSHSKTKSWRHSYLVRIHCMLEKEPFASISVMTILRTLFILALRQCLFVDHVQVTHKRLLQENKREELLLFLTLSLDSTFHYDERWIESVTLQCTRFSNHRGINAPTLGELEGVTLCSTNFYSRTIINSMRGVPSCILETHWAAALYCIQRTKPSAMFRAVSASWRLTLEVVTQLQNLHEKNSLSLYFSCPHNDRNCSCLRDRCQNLFVHALRTLARFKCRREVYSLATYMVRRGLADSSRVVLRLVRKYTAESTRVSGLVYGLCQPSVDQWYHAVSLCCARYRQCLSSTLLLPLTSPNTPWYVNLKLMALALARGTPSREVSRTFYVTFLRDSLRKSSHYEVCVAGVARTTPTWAVHVRPLQRMFHSLHAFAQLSNSENSYANLSLERPVQWICALHLFAQYKATCAPVLSIVANGMVRSLHTKTDLCMKFYHNIRQTSLSKEALTLCLDVAVKKARWMDCCRIVLHQVRSEPYVSDPLRSAVLRLFIMCSTDTVLFEALLSSPKLVSAKSPVSPKTDEIRNRKTGEKKQFSALDYTVISKSCLEMLLVTAVQFGRWQYVLMMCNENTSPPEMGSQLRDDDALRKIIISALAKLAPSYLYQFVVHSDDFLIPVAVLLHHYQLLFQSLVSSRTATQSHEGDSNVILEGGSSLPATLQSLNDLNFAMRRPVSQKLWNILSHLSENLHLIAKKDPALMANEQAWALIIDFIRYKIPVSLFIRFCWEPLNRTHSLSRDQNKTYQENFLDVPTNMYYSDFLKRSGVSIWNPLARLASFAGDWKSSLAALRALSTQSRATDSHSISSQGYLFLLIRAFIAELLQKRALHHSSLSTDVAIRMLGWALRLSYSLPVEAIVNNTSPGQSHACSETLALYSYEFCQRLLRFLTFPSAIGKNVVKSTNSHSFGTEFADSWSSALELVFSTRTEDKSFCFPPQILFADIIFSCLARFCPGNWNKAMALLSTACSNILDDGKKVWQNLGLKAALQPRTIGATICLLHQARQWKRSVRLYNFYNEQKATSCPLLEIKERVRQRPRDKLHISHDPTLALCFTLAQGHNMWQFVLKIVNELDFTSHNEGLETAQAAQIRAARAQYILQINILGIQLCWKLRRLKTAFVILRKSLCQHGRYLLDEKNQRSLALLENKRIEVGLSNLEERPSKYISLLNWACVVGFKITYSLKELIERENESSACDAYVATKRYSEIGVRWRNCLTMLQLCWQEKVPFLPKTQIFVTRMLLKVTPWEIALHHMQRIIVLSFPLNTQKTTFIESNKLEETSSHLEQLFPISKTKVQTHLLNEVLKTLISLIIRAPAKLPHRIPSQRVIETVYTTMKQTSPLTHYWMALFYQTHELKLSRSSVARYKYHVARLHSSMGQRGSS